MNKFRVLGSWFLALGSLGLADAAHAAPQKPADKEEIFRPQPGQFPPLEKALTYRGELVFVDHANRRGSIRVQGSGMFFRNDPHPFAMLPYGMVRYHGAPADLRDVPLGTVMHVHAYFPPDPNTSAVPVLPVDNRLKDANHNRGAGIFPAENHVLLLEDEPSYCQRTGQSWSLQEVDLKDGTGMVFASRTPAIEAKGTQTVERMTLDASTRIWRGRECLSLQDLVTEGIWPASGKHSLEGQKVQLGITWKPTPDGIFTRFHISDIWMDESSIQRAAAHQAEQHKAFIRSRWMPAWIDTVEYGKFGKAIVTATLFGGMDPALYDDFRKDTPAMFNAVENTLKHTHGAYGPSHMAARGTLLEVTRLPGDLPMAHSGIQIRFETDLIIEGMRPTRIVRVHAAPWPLVNVPREEYLNDNSGSLEERFPTPAIFPKY